MHELSIAQSLVEVVTEALENNNATRALSVQINIGALAGVVPDALQFCWEISTSGTPLEGSILEIVRLPIIIHCEPCGKDFELPDIYAFACPACGTLSADIRQGRELEVKSVEIADESDGTTDVHPSSRDPQGHTEQE